VARGVPGGRFGGTAVETAMDGGGVAGAVVDGGGFGRWVEEATGGEEVATPVIGRVRGGA
jgi:hypothetical protein